MNNFFKTVIPVMAVASLAIVAESCQPTAKGDDTIDFITKTDSVCSLIPDYMGDTAYIASRYSVVWPEKIGQQDFDALKDSLVNLTFGTTGVNTFEQGVAAFMERPVVEMGADTMKTEAADYAVAVESPYATLNQVQSTVSMLTPDVMVIDVQYYGYYSHAAHGMQTLRFLNYSIKEHTLLNADNFFKAGAAEAISPMIAKAANEKYAEGALFADAEFGINNFRITEQNIEFVYQPYEVGPYSSGIITVAIPTNSISDYLTPTAISTLGLEK